MTTIRAFTTIEQSKVLAEILPLESADIHYPDYYFDGNAKNPCNTSYKEAIEDLLHVYINPETKRLLPCWSLAALLGVLPLATLDSSNDHYYRLHCMERYTEWYDNPVDACYEMILKLHEQNLL